jgi:hypothetical protein
MSGKEDIPAPLVTDAEDASWALETASALWKRGEQADAVAWVRKAAQAAGAGGDDDRALWLARRAAELADKLAGVEGGDEELVIELEIEPMSRPSSEDVVTSAAPLRQMTGPPPPPRNAPSGPPPRPAAGAPVAPPRPPPRKPPPPPKRTQPSAGSAAVTPASVAPPAPTPARLPPVQAAVPPPAESEGAWLEETMTEWPPRAAGVPSIDHTATDWPPVDSPEDDLGSIEETVTEWPPRPPRGGSGSDELPTRPHLAPVVPTDPFPEEISTRELPSLAAIATPPTPPTSPAPRATHAPVGAPRGDAAEHRPGASVAPPAPQSAKRPSMRPREQVVQIQIEGDILDDDLAPPTFRPPEPPRPNATPLPRAPSARPRMPEREPEPPTRRMEMPAGLLAASAKKATLSPPVELGELKELSDLPDEVRSDFLAKGERRELAAGEVLEGFGLAVVLRGEVDLTDAEAAMPAARLRRGAVLRSRGSAGPLHSIKLVSAAAGTELASWDEAAVEGALQECPWVESELRAAADPFLARVGVMRGPLGGRFDSDLRAQLFGSLQVKALAAGETLTHENETVLGLAIVGAGEIELVKGGALVGAAAAGELLFASEVLRGARAPAQARAGASGALVLFADKSQRQALLATFPLLLEILAEM